jgi:hypothetical protein
MSKSVGYCTLICFSAVVIVLAIVAPTLLSDDNGFLKGFVGHELLALLGVILAITLASAAQLHLTLNSIEERFNRPNSFVATRNGIRSAVHWLLGLFVAALGLVVLKPCLALQTWMQSLANGLALLIVLWNILILISLTEAVFGLTALTNGDTKEATGADHAKDSSEASN